MRNALVSFLFSFVALFGLMANAQASATAANIFATIGGTTTIDRGGAIHSQARSIYSLGGGMTTFQGKRVTLMSADPPSFSAGCSGISWHFGGFAFISVDEIRQMVEAISQASLGIAIDLAMQTLCPQCYAVMSKLRDMANMMRNAAADACKVAQNFGALLKSSGIFTANDTTSNCAQIASGEAKTNGWLDSVTTSACKMLNNAESKMKEYGDRIGDFFSQGNNAAGNSPTRDQLNRVGNVTYETLDALGYADGFVKNMLLSYTGMVIITPEGQADCKDAFRNVVGSARDVGASQDEIDRIIASADARTLQSSSGAVTPANANDRPAKTEKGGVTTGKQVCYAPPLVQGIEEIAKSLICGFDPQSDMDTFALKFNLKQETLNNSSLGAMCNSTYLDSTGGGALRTERQRDTSNVWMYQCDARNTARCMNPRMQRMSVAVNQAAHGGQYTGLAWMILDALYEGVDSVAKNQPLKPRTVSILNGSGYPLYRLLNIAAVYPGMADELMQAYGSVIATHYVLDTLEKISRPGALPNLGLQGGTAIDRTELNWVRSDIMNMLSETGEVRERVLKRLSEKRVLVDTITQINRALQAEVISQGLSGNAGLALSIKQQMSELQ